MGGFLSANGPMDIEASSERQFMDGDDENEQPVLLPQVSAVLVDDSSRQQAEARQKQELNQLREQLAAVISAEPMEHRSIMKDENKDGHTPSKWMLTIMVVAIVVVLAVTGWLVISRREGQSDRDILNVTVAPSEVISIASTVTPSGILNAPSMQPTLEMTDLPQCFLETSFECVFGQRGNFPGYDCSTYNIVWKPLKFAETCEYAPFQAKMLFYGATCDVYHSNLNVTCIDLEQG